MFVDYYENIMPTSAKNIALEANESEIGTGEESKAELMISNALAKVIHLFLSVLAVLL